MKMHKLMMETQAHSETIQTAGCCNASGRKSAWKQSQQCPVQVGCAAWDGLQKARTAMVRCIWVLADVLR